MTTYYGSDTNVWLLDSSGTLQNFVTTTSAEQHKVWLAMWEIHGGNQIQIERKADFDSWPTFNGAYEQAIATLATIRDAPPPSIYGTDHSGDDTHAWMLDQTNAWHEVTFDTASQKLTCLLAAWQQMEGVGMSAYGSVDEFLNDQAHDEFPIKAGTYEYVLSVQAGLRSDGH